MYGGSFNLPWQHASCFSLHWGTSIFQRILSFAGIRDFLLNWKTSNFPIRKSSWTFKSHHSTANRRPCKLWAMPWVDRLKLSMGQPWPDFEQQCINVKSNPVFPWQQKVSRCYPFENIFMNWYYNILWKEAGLVFDFTHVGRIAGFARKLLCNMKNLINFQKALYFSG